MREAKFTLNAFLLVVLIISAIFFFFSVKLFNIAERTIVNEYYPIEGTPYAVRYSTKIPSGIYEGGKTTGELRLEGNFGYDWGVVAQGDALYLNEYDHTDLGLTLCSVVRVDTQGFEKATLLRDAVLRGRCASGELVCLGGCFMSFDYPKTNALCRLYALSSEELRPQSDGGVVYFLDADSGELLYSLRDDDALGGDFEARYLQRTLEEVRG